MDRTAGLPTVVRSASDLANASDLVMCAPLAGLTNTLAPLVTRPCRIAIVCSLPHAISLVPVCCLYTLCFTLVKFSYCPCSTLVKNSYHPRKVAVVSSLPHITSVVLACFLHALCFTLVKFSYRPCFTLVKISYLIVCGTITVIIYALTRSICSTKYTAGL